MNNRLNEIELAIAKMKYRNCKKAKYRIDRIGNPIEFKLTFEEWITIWLDSGHWFERGRGAGKYVMSRRDDIGNYEVGNVFIQTFNNNSRESAVRGKGRTRPEGFGDKISAKLKGVPKKYPVWNKGTVGIQKSGMEGKHHTENAKASIGKANSKPIMTPAGRFDSRVLAAKHYGITPEGLGARTRYYPTEYYYL